MSDSDIQFQLKAVLKCSSSLNNITLSELSDFMRESAEPLLKRGAPPGCGAEIEEWSVSGEELKLDLSSDRFVRAHDALTRLKKEFGRFLAKYRIGIRGIEIESYKITMGWEESIKLKRLPFVSELKHNDGRLTLYLDVDYAALEKRIPDRLLRLLDEKKTIASWKGKSEHWNYYLRARRSHSGLIKTLQRRW